MSNFAVIINGIVDNIIIADSKETAESVTGETCVEYTADPGVSAHIGLGYDVTTGKFEQPAISVDPTLE